MDDIDDRAAEARARLLERELFRVHQLQLEGSTPTPTAPPAVDDLATATVEQRWAQLVEQNARLGAYQVHLQSRLDKLEGALAETRQKLGQDPLTGLLSGGELARRLQEAIEACRTSREAVGLILVEVDHTYLDRCLGAQRGYWLMRQAAQRMSASITPGSSDALGRWGDSQFLAILHAPASEKAELVERLSGLARRWTQSLEKPVDFGGIPLTITASAGALMVEGEDSATALERVRRALTQAKSSGINSFHVYSEELREKARRLAALQPALTQARSQGQLQIFYQPIISARGPAMKVAGLETRLRWMHPQGVVEARQFVEVLEESGEILAIDEWVLEEACRQLAGVPDVEQVTLAVNLTPGHLLVADLPRRIFNLVEKSGLAPQRLCVELSEVCLVQAPEQTGSLARELSRMGISMSIDGFGSRLSSLAGLPVRFLKLDANLVSQLDQPECQKMCKGALGLAHQMGIEVIAKRVETPHQVAWLRQAGCDYLQGYFFSTPVPLNEVSALVHRTWS